jgi:carbamoyl-phosphate synthase large subunit
MIYQELLLEAKQKDLPTDKLRMVRCLKAVHTLRTDMNINRVFKLVDTCGQVPKHLITIRL